MDSPWRWTLFSVFIITSQNNVRVWAQNVAPNRPLPQLPNLRENDSPVSQGSPVPQQINTLRNFEKGQELSQQMTIQTESLRPPVFSEIRPPMPNVLRLPIETVATGSRPCPPPSGPGQQPNLPPIQPNTLQPRIPNFFSLPREQILSNPQTSLTPAPNLPIPQREQCSQCSQDVTPQQTPSIIIPQPSRLPPPLFSSFNPFRFFNPNPLPPSEPLTSTFPVVSQIPGTPPQEPAMQNNIVPPYPSSFLPNNIIPGPVENLPTVPVAPPNIDPSFYPTNTLPPSLPPSPLPNFAPPFLPLNPFRSLFFGPNSILKPSVTTIPPCPTENCALSYPLENPSGQNPPINPITPPCASPGGSLNMPPPPFDITHSSAFSHPNLFGQIPNFNLPVQQDSLIPPQPVNNVPCLPKSLYQPVPIPATSPPVNVFQNPIGIPNVNPQQAPFLPTAYPPLVPPQNFQPQCTKATDLSSIGFAPIARNSFNGRPTMPINVAAPVYQTTALPPVVTSPVNNPNQCSNIEESPTPITLQINMAAPLIPAPKIILVTPPPPPAAPVPVIEEDTNAVELFEPYPLPPIIIEGKRSRSKSWLPLFLVAMFAGDGCGCGGGCCDSNSGPTMVPYPIPIPTNNPVILN